MALTPEMQRIAPYVIDRTTKYRMQTKSQVDAAFKIIKLPHDTPEFELRCTTTTSDGKTRMFDELGTKLFTLSEGKTNLARFQYLIDHRVGRRYTLRRMGCVPGFGRGHVMIWEGKRDEGQAIMEIGTNAFRSRFDVVDVQSGKKMAVFHRRAAAIHGILAGLMAYDLTVSAGMDSALVAVLAVCCDKYFAEFVGDWHHARVW